MEIISKAMSLRLLFSSLLLTCCMMAVSAQSTQPNDEIWYTSTDSKPVEPFNKFAFGATLNLTPTMTEKALSRLMIA